MKKVLLIFCFTLFITGLAVAGGTAESSSNKTMYVAVKVAELKSGTGAFASTVGTLNYGDSVTVLQTSGRFMQVRSNANSSLTGWTAESNLTTRQVVAGTSSTASASEVAMAARGFNQEVEQEYRTQNRNLNYADVDRVEALTTNNDDLKKFLEEGHLAMGDK